MPGFRIHHFSCGTMCPWGGGLLTGEGGLLQPARLVCHVLLVETPDGLVLVDTGFGTGDVRNPGEIALAFRLLSRPRLREEETAVARLRELGFDPADVRHIVLTHLDIDHGGGLPDFPNAEVHVFARELEVMRNPPWRERTRYKIAAAHWAHGPRWAVHGEAGEDWFGFERVRALGSGEDEILLIPLPGHTLGHVGVAVRGMERWLLHCGDAFFHRDQVATPSSCPAMLTGYQDLICADRTLRRQNGERLRELADAHGGEVELICSHDAVQLEQYERRSS